MNVIQSGTRRARKLVDIFKTTVNTLRVTKYRTNAKLKPESWEYGMFYGGYNVLVELS